MKIEWNKATNIERIQITCEENIRDNNKRLLRFEEGTHMHSYILGMIGAFELVLSHVDNGWDNDRANDKPLYVCNPNKNIECAKTICSHNKNAMRSACSLTLKKEFEIDRPPVQ